MTDKNAVKKRSQGAPPKGKHGWVPPKEKREAEK